MSKPTETAVLYNAECPVCNFEISHYAKYASQQSLDIGFDDLNTDACSEWQLSPDDAAKRLYVRHGDEVTSGIPAFLVLWQQMPRYRWLAHVVGLPGIKQLASVIYDYALAPAIYRWHLSRKRKQAYRASR